MRRVALVALFVASAPWPTAEAKPWRAIMAPGDLAKAHAAVEDQCEKCHLVYKGVPSEKCLDCHQALLARIDKGEGFHASVSKRPCLDCHTDHRGRDASLTREAALKSFDHAQTRFPLEGPHGKTACARCHARPLDQVSPSCAGCHADPHRGSLGARCEACHAGAAKAGGWNVSLKTAAEHKLPMDGGHAKLGCKDCHAGGKHFEPKAACASCHEAQHGGTKAACDICHQVSGFKPATHDHSACTCKFPGKHITFDCLGCHAGWKFTNTPTLCSGCHAKILKHEPLGECSLCHSPLSWKRRDVFDHNRRSSFKLTDRHLTVDCVRCHPVAGKFKGAQKSCAGCHAERGAAAHGDFGACDRCHSTTGFDKSSFDHASTGFPLTGRHKALGCKDCHASKAKGYPKPSSAAPPKRSTSLRRTPPSGLGSRALDLALSLIGSPAEASDPSVPPPAHPADAACSHCHADPHPAPAGGLARQCWECHATGAWKPSTFDLEAHARTRLPLAGKHQTTACTHCHVGRQLSGLPLECSNCHLDRHGGRLGADCQRCHDPSGFKPVAHFDHQQTDFALTGAHTSAPCEGCHDGPRGRAIAAPHQGAPACAVCHVPGHGDIGADCEKCHPLATDDRGRSRTFVSARGMSFPEHAETGFPLERRHAVQACTSCHPKDGPKPEPACARCHLDPHSGQLTFECEQCHRPDRFRLARFDHDRAGWPLQGRHFVTPCATCHTAQRWVGLTTNCFDCHALDGARGKAKEAACHPFGPLDCRDCHTSRWTWTRGPRRPFECE